jgi:hypothetical protein
MRIGDQVPYRRRSVHSQLVVPPEDFVKGRSVWIAADPGGQRQEYLCTGKGDEALLVHEYVTVFPRVVDMTGSAERYRALF